MLEPIKKTTTVDLAVEKIREYIQSDEVKVGEKLPSEGVFCKELDISRTTVREAYRVLHSQGYITIKPAKGAFVHNKDQSFMQEALDWISTHKMEMGECIQVRMALDPLAASLAAQNANEQNLDALCAIHDAFVETIRRHDYVEMAELDAQFHERIVRMTNNDLLMILVRIVNHYFKVLREQSFKFEENADHAIAPHKQILTAIIEGNAQMAAQESAEHMKQAYRDLCGNEPEPLFGGWRSN